VTVAERVDGEELHERERRRALHRVSEAITLSSSCHGPDIHGATIVSSSSSAGKRVRDRRSLLGLSQATLAAGAGISRTTVTAIEGGRVVPAVAAALGIATALDTARTGEMRSTR
jgi:DNA-binding XRE family transcriptional regulator